VQEDVFEEIAPLIRSCVDGYNACIFAYGQTGSGEHKYAWPCISLSMESADWQQDFNWRANVSAA